MVGKKGVETRQYQMDAGPLLSLPKESELPLPKLPPLPTQHDRAMEKIRQQLYPRYKEHAQRLGITVRQLHSIVQEFGENSEYVYSELESGKKLSEVRKNIRILLNIENKEKF